jgi:hypothetical protein
MARAKKALRAGLVVLLCGVGPSVAHAWDEPKGLQGIPWGASQATAEKHLALRCMTDEGCLGPTLMIRTAKGLVPTKLLLRFEPGGGGLEAYSMRFAPEDFELLRAAFIELYGKPTLPPSRAKGSGLENEMLYWKGEAVVIQLNKYVNVNEGLTARGIAIVETRKAWQRKQDTKSGQKGRKP